MKQFEITTPALKDAVAACKSVMDRSVDGQEAKNLISAANATTSAVGQELKVRLAMPKLAAMEAKMIEASANPQIGAA